MSEHPTQPTPAEEPDPPAVDPETGVDLTLIRYYLGLTPEQRLQALNRFLTVLAQAKVTRRRTDAR